MVKAELAKSMLPSRADCALYQSYTFWFCGCHLRCPYCHNWKIAERKETCVRVSAEDFLRRLERLKEAQSFTWATTDCLHFTGGEPLLVPQNVEWIRDVAEGTRALGKWVSVNSSLAVYPKIVEKLVDTDIKHVAFDVKIPFSELTGIPRSASQKLWNYFVENVRMVIDAGFETEMRVPVSKLTDPEAVGNEVERILQGRKVDVIVVRPLLNRGVGNIEPRDPSWPYYYGMTMKREVAELWKKTLIPFVKKKVFIRAMIVD